MDEHYRTAWSYMGGTIVVAGGTLLHSVVLPDAPVHAFLLSLGAGSVATIAATLLGRAPSEEVGAPSTQARHGPILPLLIALAIRCPTSIPS
jgi:hypothetical protein